MWKYHLFLVSLLTLACGAFVPTGALPTRTPLPTLTPTPRFVRWDAAQVMRAIKAAGLEHKDPHFMQPEEFGSIPALATQGI